LHRISGKFNDTTEQQNHHHTYDSSSQNKGVKNKHKQESNGASKSAAPATSAAAPHNEKKRAKITDRLVFGFSMFGVVSGSVYMGHLYICLLVAAIECLLLRELVRVRYSAYFHTIQNTIPLFRTTQWMWFAVAIFYTYGDFVLEIIQRNLELHYLLPYAQYAPSIAFILYSGVDCLYSVQWDLCRDHYDLAARAYQVSNQPELLDGAGTHADDRSAQICTSFYILINVMFSLLATLFCRSQHYLHPYFYCTRYAVDL
jgi:hypothetical protein